METTGIQLQQQSRRAPFVTVVAVTLALLFGAAIGAVISTALTQPETVVITPIADTWDAGKLDAMAGRQLFTATPVAPIPWDEQKLDAMAGRQLAG